MLLRRDLVARIGSLTTEVSRKHAARGLQQQLQEFDRHLAAGRPQPNADALGYANILLITWLLSWRLQLGPGVSVATGWMRRHAPCTVPASCTCFQTTRMHGCAHWRATGAHAVVLTSLWPRLSWLNAAGELSEAAWCVVQLSKAVQDAEEALAEQQLEAQRQKQQEEQQQQQEGLEGLADIAPGEVASGARSMSGGGAGPDGQGQGAGAPPVTPESVALAQEVAEKASSRLRKVSQGPDRHIKSVAALYGRLTSRRSQSRTE